MTKLSKEAKNKIYRKALESWEIEPIRGYPESFFMCNQLELAHYNIIGNWMDFSERSENGNSLAKINFPEFFDFKPKIAIDSCWFNHGEFKKHDYNGSYIRNIQITILMFCIEMTN